MQSLEKLKRILFGEDTSNYEISLQEMKNSLNKLIEEYNDFIKIQEEFKKNPEMIYNIQFEKKEKYPEIMDKIKYRDIELIKEYEFYAMKYNILVELYNKLKKYILQINQKFILDFKVDKYKQPVAILAPYGDNINKIILLKNTFSNEDYLEYKVENNISIIDICSKEPGVNHGTFMIDALINTINQLNESKLIYSEIVASKELIDKMGYQNCLQYFNKQGFEVINGKISKQIT